MSFDMTNDDSAREGSTSARAGTRKQKCRGFFYKARRFVFKKPVYCIENLNILNVYDNEPTSLRGFQPISLQQRISNTETLWRLDRYGEMVQLRAAIPRSPLNLIPQRQSLLSNWSLYDDYGSRAVGPLIQQRQNSWIGLTERVFSEFTTEMGAPLLFPLVDVLPGDVGMLEGLRNFRVLFNLHYQWRGDPMFHTANHYLDGSAIKRLAGRRVIPAYRKALGLEIATSEQAPSGYHLRLQRSHPRALMMTDDITEAQCLHPGSSSLSDFVASNSPTWYKDVSEQGFGRLESGELLLVTSTASVSSCTYLLSYPITRFWGTNLLSLPFRGFPFILHAPESDIYRSWEDEYGCHRHIHYPRCEGRQVVTHIHALSL